MPAMRWQEKGENRQHLKTLITNNASNWVDKTCQTKQICHIRVKEISFFVFFVFTFNVVFLFLSKIFLNVLF